MKEQNNIDEIFKEGFKNFEADPGKNAWANIHANLNAGAATTAGSAAGASASWISTLVIGVVISGIAVGGYFFFNQKGEKKKLLQNQQQKTQQTIEENKQQDEVQPKVVSSVDNTADLEKDTKSTQTPTLSTAEQSNEKLNTTEPSATKSSTTTGKESTANTTVKEAKTDNTTSKNASTLDEQATDVEHKSTEPEEFVNTKIDELLNNNPSEEFRPVKKANTDLDVIDVDEKEEIENELDSNTFVPEDATGNGINGVPNVVFPNAFSPNRDGINETFKLIIDQSDEVDNIEVYVYDASMKLIKQWNGLNGEWNGTLPDGSAASLGNYLYKVIIYKDGERYNDKGFVNLF